MKAGTRLEWVEAGVGGEEAGVGGEEAGSEYRGLFPRVWLWCKGEEKMRIMGSFLFSPFFFFFFFKV